MVDKRQIAMDMVEQCNIDYQAYLAIYKTDNKDKKEIKQTSLDSCAGLLAHLNEHFPNPYDMDRKSAEYKKLLKEAKGILHRKASNIDINEISDIIFPCYIMRLALGSRRIQHFVYVREWKPFAKAYTSLINNA